MKKTDYEWLTEMGLCHRCRKQKTAPGKKFCFDCLEKFREENDRRYDQQQAKEYQKRRRELYYQKKSDGICVRCSKPATHGMYCYECSIKVRRHNIESSQKRKRRRHERGLIPEIRKEQGRCRWCGEKAMPGLQCCERHQRIFSDAGLRAYEANLRNGNNPWINEVQAWKKRHNWKPSANG